MRRQQVVDRLHKGLQSLVKKNKVEFIQGRGTLQGGKKVKVDKLTATTGSRTARSCWRART